MSNQLLTRPQARRKGMAALKKELGIRGFIQFMQDFGLNYGNYTKERKKLLTEKSVDEVIRNIRKRRS